MTEILNFLGILFAIHLQVLVISVVISSGALAIVLYINMKFFEGLK